MKFKMIHENYNVSDLDQSIKFYNEALDLHEVRRKTTDDFIIVYLSNDVSDFELELTWLKDHPQPYNLGECEFHLAFQAEDYEAAHKKHKEMGCICFENEAMGIYFIVEKSTCPGVSRMVTLVSGNSSTACLEKIVIPRSRSRGEVSRYASL